MSTWFSPYQICNSHIDILVSGVVKQVNDLHTMRVKDLLEKKA